MHEFSGQPVAYRVFEQPVLGVPGRGAASYSRRLVVCSWLFLPRVFMISIGISFNHLTSIPSGIGSLTALTYMDGHSSLVFPSPYSIDFSFGLAYNSLTALPSEMGSLVRMTGMRLDYNYLTAIPSELTSFTSLQYDKGSVADFWSMVHNNFLDCTEAMKSLPSGLDTQWCNQATQFCLPWFNIASMASLCSSVLITNKLRRCSCVRDRERCVQDPVQEGTLPEGRVLLPVLERHCVPAV